MLGRTLGEDLDLGMGRVVPKGCNILVSAMHVQHDPDLWPDPEIFRPERFLTQSGNEKGTKFFSYLPFSAGPRGCFGKKSTVKINLHKKLVLT